MLPITNINYELNVAKVLTIMNLAKTRSQIYHEKMKNWQWTHNVKHPYLYKVMRDLNVIGWVDFYFQEPNSILLPHIDPKSKCAINFILTPSPAPVTFYEHAVSKDELGPSASYVYSQAILNTTIFHSVQTTDTERILLKLCIENESYESVVKRLTVT